MIEVILIGITIISIYLLRVNTKKLWYLIMLVSPMHYFSTRIGVVVEPYTILSLLFFAGAMTNIFGVKIKLYRSFKYILPYIIYMVFRTFFSSLELSDSIVVTQGAAYKGLNYIFVTNFRFILGFCFAMGISNILFKHNSPLQAIRYYFKIHVFFVFHGLYVWYAQANGMPFNRLNRIGRVLTETDTIHTLIGDRYVVRAYSLTGEPKMLAIDAITYAVGLIIERKSYFNTILLSLAMLVLFLTQSTSGYLIFLTVILSLYIYSLYAGFRLNLSSKISLVFVIFLLVGLTQEDVFGDLKNILEVRLFNRIETEGVQSFADKAGIAALKNSIIYSLFGAGLARSNEVIRMYDDSVYTGLLSAPRGIIGICLTHGVLGLSFLGYGIIKLFKGALSKLRNQDNSEEWRKYLVSFVVVNSVFMLTISHSYTLWLLIGVLVFFNEHRNI